MMTDADALRLFGTARPPAPFQVLRAGLLETRLENGNLRYVAYDGHEVLRAVSYVVRDRDWGTLTPEILDLAIDTCVSRFTVSYTARYVNGAAELKVRTQIEGTASGALSYRTTAVANGDFETNRCGFNILHPINGVAGAPVTVEHCDGSEEETVFPDLIEPWQPFKSIRALTHRPAPHMQACCRMEGDAFEMEDQRNWSDASYKTYVRPLELPWPYTVEDGAELSQSVTLEVRTTGLADEPSRGSSAYSGKSAGGRGEAGDDPVEITLGDASDTAFPRIGLLLDPAEAGRALADIDLLGTVGPQALLCHLDPTAGHGQEALEAYREVQAAFPASIDLEYVVACDGALDAEFAKLRDMIGASGLDIASLAVCPSVDRQSTPPGSTWPDCPPLEDIYQAARAAFPGMVLGGGMFSYFTELNRKRPPLGQLDFVTHATNPIVHAADDESVMETLETLPHITRSARAIMGADMRYRLGPSTIGMRQNPYGSRTFDNPDLERICMTSDDPRQRGLFAAAWTAGYAAAIADAGIGQWVPAAFTGPRGLVEEKGGALLPAGRVVADLARLAGCRVRTCSVGDARRVAALGFETKEGLKILIANLTPRYQTVRYENETEVGPYGIVWV